MWFMKQKDRGISTTPTDWAWRHDSEDQAPDRQLSETGAEPQEWPFTTTMVSTEFQPSPNEGNVDGGEILSGLGRRLN